MKVGTDGVLLGAWARGGGRILDIGTGTGVVALMMAQRFPEAQVCGIDIDPPSCREAQENVSRSIFAERVEIRECSLQQLLKSESTVLFDAIVCNPPFFVNALKNPDARKATARHTSSLPFSLLARAFSQLLTASGTASVVVPTDVEEALSSECFLNGLRLCRRTRICTKAGKQPKRSLLEFGRCLSPTPSSSISDSTVVLSNEDGSRSPWYSALTQEFYIK